MSREVVLHEAERESAEEALRRTEQQYRSVVDNIKQVIFQTDARGVWKFLNAAWTEITGFGVEETLGKSFLSFVHPEDRLRHAEMFQPLIENRGDYFGHEARYLTKAGGFRWIEVFAQLTTGTDSRVLGIFGTLTDITERKRADEELAATRARLEHLLLSSPAVIYSASVAPPHAITSLSENIARQLGYEVHEVVDDPEFWVSRLHPDDAARARASVGGHARGRPLQRPVPPATQQRRPPLDPRRAPPRAGRGRPSGRDRRLVGGRHRAPSGRGGARAPRGGGRAVGGVHRHHRGSTARSST